ncbi:exodeoxyribonuclease V subunit alpha [Fodinibius roseus]|nr:exodeoxyribonuclease V subunit alpha [Fodinibius roseus]
MNRLSALREQGVILDIDLELCRFLWSQDPDVSEAVLMSACLTSYLYHKGNICLQLDEYAGGPLFEEAEGRQSPEAPALEEWKNRLSESPFVGGPGTFRPLILDSENRLYLHKLWHHEHTLAAALLERCRDSEKDIDVPLLHEGLERLFSFQSPSKVGTDWQRVAAALAVKHTLSVISGGPGTGKTSTVVRILALLAEQGEARGRMPAIALTAPTGKAAARLQEAIQSARESLPVTEGIREAIPGEAVTLHQLLGARRYTSRFRHNKENPLSQDVVVIDEVSMVDQALMSRVMEALLEGTKLILLGDKDQLASVEAGSVLGDICRGTENRFSSGTTAWLQSLSLDLPGEATVSAPDTLTDYVTLLTESYRFGADSGIARLAESVNRGEAEEAIAFLKSEQYPEIALVNSREDSALEELLAQRAAGYFDRLSRCSSPDEAFAILNEFRILAAHRRGPWGIRYLNRYIERILQERGSIPKYQQWYPGKPVMVNVNDYSLGLYNGDTGICLANEEQELRVYFQHDNAIREVAPSRLPDHNKAYALTVHKSQGSEFNNILIVLPAERSKVVSRELIYTAITRARKTVIILTPEEILRQGIREKLQRTSGLSDRLWP